MAPSHQNERAMKTLKNILIHLLVMGTALCVNCNREFGQKMGVRSDYAIGDDYVSILRDRGVDPAQRDNMDPVRKLIAEETPARMKTVKIYREDEGEELNVCQIAAIYDDDEIIQYLWDNGFQRVMWYKTEEGRGIVHFAAKHGSTRVLRKLYELTEGDEKTRENGFWAIDGLGQLSIHYAAAHGKVETLEMLCGDFGDEKHNVVSPSNSGFVAMHLVAMLQPNDPDEPEDMQVSEDVVRRTVGAIIALGEAGHVDTINTSANGSNTPLHVACYGENVLVEQLLREAGARDDVANEEGKTCDQVRP